MCELHIMSQFDIHVFGIHCSEMAFYLHHKIPDRICLNLYDFWFASQKNDFFTTHNKQFLNQNEQLLTYFSNILKNKPPEIGDIEMTAVRAFNKSLLEFQPYFKQLMLPQQNPVPAQPTASIPSTVQAEPSNNAQPVPRPMYHPVAPVVRPPPGGPQAMNPGGRMPVNQQEQAARGWEYVRRKIIPQGHVQAHPNYGAGHGQPHMRPSHAGYVQPHHVHHTQGAGHGQAHMRPAHSGYVQPQMYALDPRNVPPSGRWQQVQRAVQDGVYHVGDGVYGVLAGRLDENNEKDTTDLEQEDENEEQHHEDKESSATTLRALLTQLQEL
jgi:hypothetical protein